MRGNRGCAVIGGLVLLVAFAAAAPSQAAFPLGANGKIAYNVFTSGIGDDIALMNADGSGQQNLTMTPQPANEVEPAFSPTGRQIAYARSDGPSQSAIWIMAADGSGQGPITAPAPPGSDGSPAF